VLTDRRRNRNSGSNPRLFIYHSAYECEPTQFPKLNQQERVLSGTSTRQRPASGKRHVEVPLPDFPGTLAESAASDAPARIKKTLTIMLYIYRLTIYICRSSLFRLDACR
jgi:hypothetical protein